jgi:hypothetical protein
MEPFSLNSHYVKKFPHSTELKDAWLSWIRASWYNYENYQQDEL